MLFLSMLPIRESLSNRSPSSIDTASKSENVRTETIMPPTFINDKDLRPQPPSARFLVLADLLGENFGTLNTQSNPGERMDSDATNVTCGNACGGALGERRRRNGCRLTRGGGDCDSVIRLAMLFLQRLDDFA
jgi:hypothetical protein